MNQSVTTGEEVPAQVTQQEKEGVAHRPQAEVRQKTA